MSLLFIRDMASNMIDEFVKYKDRINAKIKMSTILDPRYKMMLLTHFFPLMHKEKLYKKYK